MRRSGSRPVFHVPVCLIPICHVPVCLTLLILLPHLHAAAQTPGATNAPAPAPSQAQQLSPKAAYDDSLHPLVVTRQNIANWSDTELAAMNVAIARAKAACSERPPAQFTGPDLIDLTRLCALGQAWPAVVDAASRYIAEPSTNPKLLLPDAYVAKIHAELRLRAERAVLDDSVTLLKTVPYTPDVADSLDETLGYMHFLLTADALTLSRLREMAILQALAQANTPATQANPAQTTTSAQTTVPIHQLYAEGLAFAALQQLAAQPAAAKSTVAALDAVLPATLGPDDALPIADARRRYALLGHRLTGLEPTGTLQGLRAPVPKLPANLTITAFLLFPDWCAQCVRMGTLFPETVFSVQDHSAYLWGLLAQTVPSRQPDSSAKDQLYKPAFAASMLAGTSTVTVTPAVLDRFGGSDYPLLLLTDANGILRLIEPITADDLRPGGDVDSAIALVGKTFPPVPPGSSAPNPPATPAAPHSR